MNPFNSIKARIDSFKNTRKSKYWEYTKQYLDGEIWDKTFFFEAFGGVNFQGNPYYVYKELFKDPTYAEYSAIIAHKNPKLLQEDLEKRGLIDGRVRIVEFGSDAYKEAVEHAKYLVNNVGFNIDFIKKSGQVYLNTWHGSPLKTIGRSIQGDPFACMNGQRNFLLADYLLAPNELTKNAFAFDYMVDGIMPGELYLGGFPRNSVFFDESERATVRKKYGLDGVTSIFYMPTWRGTASGGSRKVDQISEMERLAKELGDKYRIYVKFHPAMASPNTQFEYCYQMPQNIEVYEFLNAVDVLITDYSSVFFDYANTGKKIVLYQYDKEEYLKERGVYPEVEENTPFPVAYTYEELITAIKKDNEPYPQFIERFCKYDGAGAAKAALDKMLSGEGKNNSDAVDLYVINFPVTDESLLAMRDKLQGRNYRFAFLLGKVGFGNVHCWSEINYTALNVYNRLTAWEKIKEKWHRFVYALFRCKGSKRKMQELAKREQTRLFGDMPIGRIYAKNKKLPISVRIDAEAWPTVL